MIHQIDLKSIKPLSLIFIIAILFLPGVPISIQPAFAIERMHSVFFEDTDYQLHVYRIYGKKVGKTLMLIGGIQGNEPGGFHSADLYTDISLARGNLIVVPRANFKSIVLNRRQINADMNRKFADDQRYTYETKIVSILKKLIAESDCLLNLHDGSGFFSEEYKSSNRNPMQYGQSIIADCDVYTNEKTGKKIYLGDIAGAIAEKVNQSIHNPLHRIHFNNHRTKETDSHHKEQRKSATYFALFTCGIPAFGIEASKTLSLEWKIKYHNLVINSFMEKYGIIPETPGIRVENPKLKYIVISVNDAIPVVLEDKQTLHINRGDTISISHVEANYNRGLTADIIERGSYNDIRKAFKIFKPTRIIVKKDAYPCGSIEIRPDKLKKSAKATAPETTLPHLKFFKIRVNGKEKNIKNNSQLHLVKGDTLQILDVAAEGYDPARLVVNFKGYVGNRRNNSGEDRGYIITMGKDLWKRYSLEKKGKKYKVVATLNDELVGKFLITLR